MTREANPGRATVVPVEAASWREAPANPRLETSGDSERTYGKAKRA